MIIVLFDKLSFAACVLCLFLLSGCGGSENSAFDLPQDMELVAEESIAPEENSVVDSNSDGVGISEEETNGQQLPVSEPSDLDTTDPEIIEPDDNDAVQPGGDLPIEGQDTLDLPPAIKRITAIEEYPVGTHFVFNRFGQVAYFGSTGSETNNFGVLMGTFDEVTSSASIGLNLPDIEPSTQVERAANLSIAHNGTVAFTATLRGSRPGMALVVAEGSEVQTVFRDGWNLDPVNATGGEITSFSLPQKLGSGVVVEANFGFGNTILGLWDDGEFSAIAGTSVISTAIVNIDGVECDILLSSALGVSGGPSFRVTEQDHVLFAATFNSECPYSAGIVRYEAGSYAIVVARGMPVPGMDGITFNGGSLIEVAPNGTVAFRSNVNGGSVDHPGLPAGVSRSIWQATLDGNYKLLVVQGETVETSVQTYELDPLAVLGGAFRWVSTGYFGWREEFDQEGVLLIGRAREELPYENFDMVGASNLVYQLGTLDIVPAPFGENSFHSEFRSFHLVDNGRALVFTQVDSTVGDSSTVLWLSDTSGRMEMIMQSGDFIPTKNGNEFLFVSELLSESINMADGSVIINKGSQAMFHIEFE